MHNQNRAHIEKGGSVNRPTDMTAGGGAAGPISPGEMPPPLRGDAPMTLDPHAGGRGAFDNMVNKPGERSRSSFTDTLRRTVEPAGAKTRRTP
jgi:hypothetical protein